MSDAVNHVLADIQPSFIRMLNDRRRPSSLNLGLGEPDINPDADLIEDGLKRFSAGVQGYTRNAGLPELRSAIARFRSDVNMNADNVLVTTGSQEAVFISLGALLNPGDEVLVVDPAFNIYAPISKLFGARAISVSMDPNTGFALDASRVRAAVTPKTRVICVVSPGNPTGRALDETQAKALAALADETGTTLLVDEVYRELHHTPSPAPSPGQWSKRVITLGGLSKSCAMTGLRIGWAHLPDYAFLSALKLHQLCATCAASLSQHIAVAAFERNALFRHRARYAERFEVASELVKQHLGMTPPTSEGAFYLFLDFRKFALPTMQIAEQLLEKEDVCMIPGEAFGPAGHGFFRISFAQDLPVIREGILRLGRFVGTLKTL